MMAVDQLGARVAFAKNEVRTEGCRQNVHLASKRAQWEAEEREALRQRRREQAAWERALVEAASKRMHAEVAERRAKAQAEKEQTHWGLDVKGRRTRFKRPVGRHSLRSEKEHRWIFHGVEPVEFDDATVNTALGQDALMILAIGVESTRRHGDPLVRLKLSRFAVELGYDPRDLRPIHKALTLLSEAGLHSYAGQLWFNVGERQPVLCHARAFTTLNLNSEGQAVTSDELRAWAADKASRNWGGRRPGAGRPRKQPKEASENQDSDQRRRSKILPQSPSGIPGGARARVPREGRPRPVSQMASARPRQNTFNKSPVWRRSFVKPSHLGRDQARRSPRRLEWQSGPWRSAAPPGSRHGPEPAPASHRSFGMRGTTGALTHTTLTTRAPLNAPPDDSRPAPATLPRLRAPHARRTARGPCRISGLPPPGSRGARRPWAVLRSGLWTTSRFGASRDAGRTRAGVAQRSASRETTGRGVTMNRATLCACGCGETPTHGGQYVNGQHATQGRVRRLRQGGSR